MWKNRKGFSLIEIIIVIAILGVLAGSSVAIFGHISYANTKKVVEEVDTALSRLRLDTMTTMSQEKPQYLYIYRLKDGYYMKLYEDKLKTGTFDITASATRLCGNNVTIKTDAGGLDVCSSSATSYICIAYTKSGLFQIRQLVGGTETGGTGDKDKLESIEISGNGTYTIKLTNATGRHYIE